MPQDVWEKAGQRSFGKEDDYLVELFHQVFGHTDCNGCHSVSADGSLLLAQSVASGAMSY